MPVFARGLSPSSPFKDGPAEINDAISCGGVAVHPGDVIVGDEEGVVVIPQNDLMVVAERLQGVFAKEAKMLAAIEAGQLTNPVMIERPAEVGVNSWTNSMPDTRGYGKWLVVALLFLATFGLGCFMVNYLAFTSEVLDKKVSTAVGLLSSPVTLAGALFMLLVG